MHTDEHLAEYIFDALAIAAKAHRLLPELPPNLKPLHFRVLHAIYQIRAEDGSSRISDINSRLGFLLPNTTKLINELVELKVVEKSTSETDKRVVLVRVTPIGEQYISTYVVRHDTDLRREFATLDEADCLTMIATIEKVYNAMQKVYREKGQPEGIIHA